MGQRPGQRLAGGALLLLGCRHCLTWAAQPLYATVVSLRSNVLAFWPMPRPQCSKVDCTLHLRALRMQAAAPGGARQPAGGAVVQLVAGELGVCGAHQRNGAQPGGTGAVGLQHHSSIRHCWPGSGPGDAVLAGARQQAAWGQSGTLPIVYRLFLARCLHTLHTIKQTLPIPLCCHMHPMGVPCSCTCRGLRAGGESRVSAGHRRPVSRSAICPELLAGTSVKAALAA